MPRAVWTGVIAFGLVNVPVKLYTAVQERSVKFHQREQETGSRIRYRRVSEDTGEEVPNERIARAYELEDGRYVTIEDHELEAAAPESVRTIAVEEFVDVADVDPRYFNRTYYAGPSGDAAGRPYALLVRAMEESGRAAVGRLVLRSKEHLVLARPVEGRLTLHTMHFADEVVAPTSIEAPSIEPEQRELAAATQLIDAWTEEWEPTRHEDRYREHLLQVIDQKVRGEEIAAAPTAEEPSGVIDLVAALQESARRQGSPPPQAEAGEASADESPPLEERSRDELYELAQTRQLPGRSRMTKEQLIEALRAAEEPHHAKSA
ncbi:Ku protein [Egibacter rhizosphaerae]|uniref:Non-homologous end joining protein Ku n=1 Tax=Egibacter rhizosphaerae TaxID=1670831 RepID=A0A411YAY4_9ACTN|nr:Ku protein [Egibacter rhizosphaerae]QBI18342.1 Ku protein [Egibacter rhizosphaerae]